MAACHARVGRQAEIIVRAAHDEPVAAEHRLGALVLGQGDEVGINPGFNGLFGFGEAVAFLEKIHDCSVISGSRALHTSDKLWLRQRGTAGWGSQALGAPSPN